MKYDEYERVMRTQRSNYVSSRYFSNACCATLTLLLGPSFVHSVSFLKKYTIPEPVAGRLLVALALLVLKKASAGKSTFICPCGIRLCWLFFATIGLNANLASLRAGGRVVGVFLIVVVWPVGDAKCHWHWYG
ncbi:sodium/glutamate symporter [Shigella sonnei]